MNISIKAPNFPIVPKEHFWVKGLRKTFDLSGLVPLYLHVSNNLDKIVRNKDFEITIGKSTIVYSLSDNNEIQLISGWVGNRKKQ